jgi:hypothetical protein
MRADLEGQMKAPETVQKFIELRAQGWSFVRIAQQYLSPCLPHTDFHTDFIPILDRFSTARRGGWSVLQPEAEGCAPWCFLLALGVGL